MLWELYCSRTVVGGAGPLSCDWEWGEWRTETGGLRLVVGAAVDGVGGQQELAY